MKLSKKRGFTLIEVLVVVLIIGILAAVALPQYQRAVEKSKGAEIVAAVNVLDKSLQAYYLANGTYDGANKDTLPIGIPPLKYHYYYAQSTHSHSFQVGCSVSNENYDILITDSTKDAELFITFKADGTIKCNETCAKYFQCNMKYREAYPGGPTMTECYLY